MAGVKGRPRSSATRWFLNERRHAQLETMASVVAPRNSATIIPHLASCSVLRTYERLDDGGQVAERPASAAGHLGSLPVTRLHYSWNLEILVEAGGHARYTDLQEHWRVHYCRYHGAHEQGPTRAVVNLPKK
jgi:hypothetical protein